MTSFGGAAGTKPSSRWSKPPAIQDRRRYADHLQQKALLAEIIGKRNLLESEALRVQAPNNSKAQFVASPRLANEIMEANMAALEAHETMSNQALNSQKVLDGLKVVLLGPGQLYEAAGKGRKLMNCSSVIVR